MQIRKLARHKINDNKWNQCINQAENSRIYALSWYLDAVTDKQWDALILDDYHAVMPLPYARKFGIKFYTQPIFCQQLGPFWKGNHLKNMMEEFVHAIPKRPYMLSLNAETGRYIHKSHSTFKTNYILPLEKSYQEMIKCMSNNHKRNIKKADKKGLTYNELSISNYIDLKKSSGTQLNKQSWTRLENLLSEAKTHHNLDLRAAFLDEKLVSAVCWLKDGNRLVYLQAASNEMGKKSAAAFGLVDEVLKKHTESNMLIDFEGSENPGVARFYQGFNAKNEAFPLIKSKSMQMIQKWRGR